MIWDEDIARDALDDAKRLYAGKNLVLK